MNHNSLDFEDFVIEPVSGDIPHHKAALAVAAGQDPLGPLCKLRGVFKGTGFNQIWRPFAIQTQPPQDRFLELNETEEVLQFVEIKGDIPNRGLLQQDINLHGLTYLQRINDVNVKTDGKPTGIHIEPGIWIRIPATSNPQDPETVARLANIPHGTSLVAQGIATPATLPLVFPAVDITPFVIGQPTKLIPFPEPNLTTATKFRTPPQDIPNVTQQMVNNPNVVLANGLVGKTIKSVTQLKVSTVDLNPPPNSGGGTSNIAFRTGVANKPNANTAEMDATFWISDFVDAQGNLGVMLQYSQRVLLNFNGLSWPHVSVANLVKV